MKCVLSDLRSHAENEPNPDVGKARGVAAGLNGVAQNVVFHGRHSLLAYARNAASICASAASTSMEPGSTAGSTLTSTPPA